MSLYSYKIPKSNEIYRKAMFLPRKAFCKVKIKKNILYSHKETPRCAHFSGVLTIEAAIVLPLLTYFFVSILFFFRVMQVQLIVQDAINRTGRQMALLENQDAFLEVITAKTLFVSELEDDILIEAYVQGGKGGISFVQSQFDDQEIHLNARYRISLPLRLFWEVVFEMQQRADCRRWNGWHSGIEMEGCDEWVYVTETGHVYHRRETCSHLELSIRSVKEEQLAYLRNENGAKYESCLRCGNHELMGNNVYITNQGDCYHKDLACSGIRRTVYMIRESEVGNRRSCSRCGMGENSEF